MLNKDKISYTNATVIDTTTAVPEAVKVINSRLANVSLSVNGKQYISAKRVQVPMNTSVGDQIKVAYYKDDPSIIFTPSWRKMANSMAVGILCLAIEIYFRNGMGR